MSILSGLGARARGLFADNKGPWGQTGGNGDEPPSSEGGGGGPWGQGPGSQPPDLEEMLKRSQDRMKQVMHGGGIERVDGLS